MAGTAATGWTAAALALSLAAAPVSARAAEGRVRATRLGAPPVEGVFASIDATTLRLAGAEPVPLADVREARFPAEAPRAARAEVSLRAFLRGGEEVRGAFVSGDSEALTIKPADLEALRVPFDAIRRVETEDATARAADPCAEPARGRPARPGTDVAHARSGDAFPGTLVSAGPSGVVLETGRDRRQPVSWADLVVLHLDEPEMPAPAGLVAEVETAGGSRLVSTSVVGDARGLRVVTRSGLSVAVPVPAVAVIRWSGGSFVYACDLPFQSTYTPYYGDGAYERSIVERFHGTRVDRRPYTGSPGTGCPLRIAGTTYRHGFAVHSKSVVTVPLGKAFRSFEAVFGIDDEAAVGAQGSPGGDVVARVLADGKEIWSSQGSVRGGQPPRTVGPLPVEGVETLALEVDYGEGLFALGRADWADPILVRARR